MCERKVVAFVFTLPYRARRHRRRPPLPKKAERKPKYKIHQGNNVHPVQAREEIDINDVLSKGDNHWSLGLGWLTRTYVGYLVNGRGLLDSEY